MSDPGATSRRCPRLKAIAAALVFVALANSAVFMAIADRLGGDGLNGKAENGRYYVMAKGQYTRVTRSVWIYSRVHAITVLANYGAAVGVSLLVVFLERQRKTDAAESLRRSPLSRNRFVRAARPRIGTPN